MQFVSEVAAAAITNTSAIFSFIGDYGLFLGLAWLAYLVFKPDNIWPRNQQVIESPTAEPSVETNVVVDNPSQLDRERDQAALKALDETLQFRTGERDAFLEECNACRVEFAHANLSWIAERAILNGDTTNVAVVRFAIYDDYDLATRIKATIQQNMQWPVELDGTNNPTIKPSADFKVIFESDLRATFDEIAKVFISGNLLNNVSIGIRHIDILEDKHRLVVEVAPTVKR